MLQAAIALLFFFTQPYILTQPGVTYADFTAMMLVALATAIYLLFHRLSSDRAALLIVFGLCLFLAVKSKETGVIAAILLAGMVFPRSGKFDLPLLRRRLGFVLLGVGTGMICLVVLDQVFLGDALFGWRIISWKGVAAYHAKLEWERYDGTWYEVLVAKRLLVPFFLSLLSAVQWSQGRFPPANKVLWLLPLGGIFMLTVNHILGG